MRTLVTLACTECKRRNYTTKKNKQNNPDRIEFRDSLVVWECAQASSSNW